MIEISYGASLLRFNTFGIDVKASVLIEYDTVSDLAQLYADGNLRGRLLNVGQGSNLLFVSDFEGMVLHCRNRSLAVERTPDGHAMVTAGAGWAMDSLIALTVEQGFGGLENLSNIPGEVGSSAVQNVGAYGVEAADRIVKVEAFDVRDGVTRAFVNDDCRFAYRDSRFKRPDQKRWVITAVTFCLDTEPRPVLTYSGLAAALGDAEPTPANIRRAIIDVRGSKLPDPAEIGSAGSFFTNPVVTYSQAEALLAANPGMPVFPVGDGMAKISAGWLIDRAGWKGRRLGRAGVYSRNALVIINLGGATGDEIVALAEAVMADVKERYGIELRPEVNIIR